MEDILITIFLFLRDGDKEWASRWVSVGALVSSVSPQWRAIAFLDSSLWRDVFIGPSSSPAMTRRVLDRAGEHNIRVFIWVPEGMGGILFNDFPAPFSTSMQLVIAQSARWEKLSVVSPFFPLLRITKLLSSSPLTQLHSMELIRSDPAYTVSCGPFILSSVIFRHLVLDGVIIRPADSSQLSNLSSLSVANTDLRMLDGVIMNSFTSVPISTDLTPSMTSIQHLSISAPLLPYISSFLSFDPSTLVSLKLGGLSGDSLLPCDASVSLVSKLLTENLRSLELTDMDREAVKSLFFSLRGRIFRGLRTLKAVSTDLQGLAECKSDIRSIFPGLTSFPQVLRPFD